MPEPCCAPLTPPHLPLSHPTSRWFQAQGLVAAPRAALTMHRAPSMPTLGPRPASAPPVAGPAPPPRALPSPGQYAPSGLEVLNDHRQRGLLLVCDFDKTLIHYDAGGFVCGNC